MGQSFQAIGVRPGQSLHEWRKVGVVRLEPVGRHGLGDHQLGANDFHQDQEEQGPCDESCQGGEGGVHVGGPEGSCCQEDRRRLANLDQRPSQAAARLRVVVL